MSEGVERRRGGVGSFKKTSMYYMTIASVPALPRFDLPFVFTIIRGIGRLANIKTGKALGHSSHK